MSELRVELQYIDGCGNAALADELLQSVLADLAPGVSVHRVEVKDETQGREIGFHGSPTIRINGVDVDGATGPGAGFSWRTYGGAGVPPREQVEDAIRRALTEKV